MTFSRQNLDFTLFEALRVGDLPQHALFSAHHTDTMSMALDAATEIAAKTAQPAYTDSDQNPPRWEAGQLKVHPGVHAYVKTFAEAGLIAAPFPEAWGGMQLPKTIAAVAEFMIGSAHNSFVMYTDLAKGAANLILRFGTEAQKQFFLPNILSGKWLCTMCLTETEAGSSLSDIQTAAFPQPDGTYRIKGQKIFISAGDHDVGENIIHLVLARIEGAPKGTKGISLFIVPKYDIRHPTSQIPNPKSNGVTSVGVYHKMGQKATPALHLEFGGEGPCTGYLLGEANRGLQQMFQMMNGARLGVGAGGIQIASAAYHASLQYAQARRQGRRLHDKSALGEPVAIIEHPDVQRMLLLQKAIVEGGLSFVLQCYLFLDLEKALASEPATQQSAQYYNDLLELLTPAAKTYGAEMGFVSIHQGLQVLGGYGYTEDFPLAQMARDCRIMSLYEGTSGIQSQALLGRQVLGNQGRSLRLWYELVRADLAPAREDDALRPYWEKMENSLQRLQATTEYISAVAARGDMETALADANLYMEAFGILNVGWQWLKQGIALRNGRGASSRDAAFQAEKMRAMRFYFHYEMPRLHGLFERLNDDTVLTIFEPPPGPS